MRRTLILAATIVAASQLSVTSVAQPLTGTMRTEFVDSGVRSCIDRAMSDIGDNPDYARAMGITREKIRLFCRCQMEMIADEITPDDFVAAMRKRITNNVSRLGQEASERCGAMFLRPAR